MKYVVDLERRVVAVGGELHADAEALLLDSGSAQEHLWGANYYPGKGAGDCIEYTAPINIRPAQGNRSMEVENPELRRRIRDLTFELYLEALDAGRSKTSGQGATNDGGPSDDARHLALLRCLLLLSAEAARQRSFVLPRSR